MIRFLVNSKYLFSKLQEINFKDDEVQHAYLVDTELTLITQLKEVKLHVSVVRFTEPRVKQFNRKWDWLRDVVRECEEQPIVIEVHEGVLNLIFQF